MDKYEYKIRSEEIRALIAKGEYAEAAALADTIDWRRVKSVMMLCTISDLYKINRRYEDARDMLLLAYDRHPGGRSIVYSLCELSIKMEDFVPAVEYYKEFVQVAPKDSGRYVLQYKLYEAQEVSLEERIAVLEELKAKDYTEKWAYELAYLYHRIGLGTRCVEECDELILWFGEGKYVMKALELKRLHEPLTEEQQEKYDNMKGNRRPVAPVVEEPVQEKVREEDLANAPTKIIPQEELDIQVKLMNVGQYDTINIQKELAENMKELWEGPSAEDMARAESEKALAAAEAEREVTATELSAEETVQETVEDTMQESDTIFEEASLMEQETGIIDLPDEMEEEFGDPQETKVEEVFFGETGEIDITGTRILEEMRKEVQGDTEAEAMNDTPTEEPAPQEVLVSSRTGDMTEWHVEPKPTKFDKMLGMDYDGQISMVMPEAEKIEKQITGQICLEDVLVEWEKLKKDSEQKRMEAVRQRVKEQTGAMFTEFDVAVRDGLLEQLENGTVDSIDDEMIEEAMHAEAAEPLFEGEMPEELTGEEYDLNAAAVAAVSGAAVIAGAALTDSDAEPEENTESEEFEGLEEIADIEELEETETEDIEEAGTEEMFEEDSEEVFEDIEEEPMEEPVETSEEEYTEEPEISEEPILEEYPEEMSADGAFDEEEAEPEEEEATGDEIPEEFVAEPDEEDLQESESEEETEEGDEENTGESVDEESDEAGEDDEDKKAADRDSRRPKGKNPSARMTREKKNVRDMSPEEEQLFAAYIQSQPTKEQIVEAIDNISLAAYTGNVLITGEEGMDTMTLAKNLIKEVQQTDSNFSGKIAKISGTSLNRKDVDEIIKKLGNGALIIQKAGTLKKETAEQLRSALEQDENGIIIVMEDTKKAANKLLKNNEFLKECFTIRIDLEPLDNATLVKIAKEYAREQEYSIDDMGVLALHTCIAERQTSEHAVTVAEVKELVDDAIWNANRKTVGHFFDVLLAKRYDDEDMIILREKDFI